MRTGIIGGLFGLVGLAAACVVGCSSSSSLSGDCTTLTSCCSQMTPDSPGAASQGLCQQIVADGNATACAQAQQEFTGAAACVVVDTSSSSGGGCAELTSCCTQLSGSDATVCASIAGQGDDTTCTELLPTYEEEGCKVSTTTTTTATGCSGLATCCPAADQTACQALEQEGDDTVCTDAIESYCPASPGTGIGTGTGTGSGDCATLSSCCSSLNAEEQPGCNELVTVGVEADCSAGLTEYQCGGGGGTTPDAGTGSGGGCSSLSTCCSQMSGIEQTECQDIVTEGDDTACSADLTSYEDSDLCSG